VQKMNRNDVQCVKDESGGAAAAQGLLKAILPYRTFALR